jgi:hypothetical protein
MEGNSNSATLVDHRPVSQRNQWDRHTPFRDQADVDGLDCAWWDEPRDAFSGSRSPLSVAGFVRLGGLNRATCKARGNPNRRDNSHRVDVDVLPPAYVQPSFRPPQSAVGVSWGNGVAAESLTNPTASSALIGANILFKNETLLTAPETDCNAIAGAVKDDSAPELNDAASAEPLPAAAVEPCPFEQLQMLSKRVKAGDESAMAEIQQILNSNDALWRHLGDVEKTTEAMLIEVADGPAAYKESIRRSVAAMKQSLLGEHRTPLERMAVGRVVSCWLFANFVDRWCAWSVKQQGRASDLAKLLEASEKRCQISLRSLKLVRGI